MSLRQEERDLLNKWLADSSFIGWAKESNSEDITKWELYLNSNHQHWELAKTGRLLVLGVPFNREKSDKTDATKSAIKFVERLEKRNIPKKIEKSANLRSYRWLLRVAAIGIILIIASVGYIQFFQNEEVTLATTYGQQLESVLPDGSEITLNANSTIKYNSNNPRKVYLEGEAFFNIKKKPQTQENFKVLTNDLEVIVLGTSFNVNSRNDQTKVFLEEGKIDLKVEDKNTGIIEMIPGDLVTYSKRNNELRESKDNASPLENSSWRGGALIFTEMYLSDALYEIEDIYGIQFVIVTESLRKEKIRGGVPINDLKVTMQTLNELYGINIREHGKRYFLSRSNE